MNRDEIDAGLAAYIPFTESVAPGSSKDPIVLPTCDDPNDQQFLEAAAEGGAEALVTGDNDLLRLAEDVPFAIVTPAELRSRLS